ncbi:MAG TPA: hypothetical protein VD769_02075 [Gaiellaceae bacterium]|nr:hypothetical protein [Gaiellaceae bacterium]
MRKTLATVLVGAALAVSGCMGSDEDEAATTSAAPPATSTAEAEPPAPPKPSGFTADAAPFEVVLTWEAPSADVQRFELFRDGASLAIVTGSTTSFTDEDVTPGQAYAYQIAAQAGELVSERVNADAVTPVPPLRAARIDGTFNVATRFTRKTGYGDYSRPNFGWRFVPRCRTGPCDVLVRDIHERRFRVRLERRGARYAGTYQGQFTIECEGNRSTSTVEIDLRVAAAAAIDGEWLATRVRGTMEQSEVAQFGCRSAEAAMTFRGRLPR